MITEYNFCYGLLLSRLFPHIQVTCHYYCRVCTSTIPEDNLCHGSDSIRYFVMADIERQLVVKFAGNYSSKISVLVRTLDSFPSIQPMFGSVVIGGANCTIIIITNVYCIVYTKLCTHKDSRSKL